MPFQKKTVRVKARHYGSEEGWTNWSVYSYAYILPISQDWIEVERTTQGVYVTQDGMQLIPPNAEEEQYVLLKRIDVVTFQRQIDGAVITQIFDHPEPGEE